VVAGASGGAGAARFSVITYRVLDGLPQPGFDLAGLAAGGVLWSGLVAGCCSLGAGMGGGFSGWWGGLLLVGSMPTTCALEADPIGGWILWVVRGL